MNIGAIVTPNTKGQIVIPFRMRRSLGITPQTSLQLLQTEQSIILHPVVDAVRKGASNETFAEILKRTAGSWGPKTAEEKKTERLKRRRALVAAQRRRHAW